MTYSQFISTLSNCLQLSNLLITGDLFNEPKRVTHYTPSVHLPQLRLLRITNAPGRTIDSLLRLITAPLLDELIMEDINTRNLDQAFEPWGSSMYIDHLVSVRSLTLKAPNPLATRTMRRLSQSLPSVSRLIFVGPSPHNVLLYLDKVDVFTRALPWPFLNCISLNTVHFDKSPTSSIFSMTSVLHRDETR